MKRNGFHHCSQSDLDLVYMKSYSSYSHGSINHEINLTLFIHLTTILIHYSLKHVHTSKNSTQPLTWRYVSVSVLVNIGIKSCSI